MARLRFVVLVVCAAASLGATPLFVTGDLIWASSQDSRFFEITPSIAKQNLSGATPFQTFSTTQYGQMAFSADAKTAYVTIYGQNKVVAISSTGAVTTVATGVSNPTGIIRTSSGKLLVSSYMSGNVYDITGATGQDFSTVQPWAWGLKGPRNLVETPNGIYVAEQFASVVSKITPEGGDQTNVASFATLGDPSSLAWFNGKLYASSGSEHKIYDISAGGAIAMSQSNAYAYGQNFTSLAVSGNKLYAGTAGSTTAGSGIWDISTASVKNYSGTTYAIAYNLPVTADSLLAVVPAAEIIQPPPAPAQVPEPGTILVGAALLAGSYAVRRRL